MLSLNFLQSITKCGTEIMIGRNDCTIHIKFNDCLGIADGAQLSWIITEFFFQFDLLRDIFPGQDGSCWSKLIQTDFKPAISELSRDGLLTRQPRQGGLQFPQGLLTFTIDIGDSAFRVKEQNGLGTVFYNPIKLICILRPFSSRALFRILYWINRHFTLLLRMVDLCFRS